MLELMSYREKGGMNGACANGKRETKIVPMLHFINNQVWKSFFGKPADGLEQSMEDEDEYRILEKSPITNKFISKSYNVNCAAYMAGIIEGILNSSKLFCKVSSHLENNEEDQATTIEEASCTTIYVIKFNKEVTEREKTL